MCFYARSPAAAVVSIRGISKKVNWRYKSVCHSSPFVHCVYLSKLETVNASTRPETIQKKAEKRISVNCHPANVCRSLNNIFWKTEKSVGKTFYFCVAETGKIQFYLCNVIHRQFIILDITTTTTAGKHASSALRTFRSVVAGSRGGRVMLWRWEMSVRDGDGLVIKGEIDWCLNANGLILKAMNE